MNRLFLFLALSLPLAAQVTKITGNPGDPFTIPAGGVTGLSVNADGSVNASKALTWANATKPTVTCAGTTTMDLSLSNLQEMDFPSVCSTTLAFINAHGSGPYHTRTCNAAAGAGTYSAFTNIVGMSQPSPGAATTFCTEQEFSFDGTNLQASAAATCPTCQPGVSLVEGNGLGGATGTDQLYGKTATHWLMGNFNNAGELFMLGSATLGASGQVLTSNGAGIAPSFINAVSNANFPWLYKPTSGSGTTYVGTPTLLDGTAIASSLLSAPVLGQQMLFVPDVLNTGAATVQIDGVNNRALRKGYTAGGAGVLVANDIGPSKAYILEFNGTSLWYIVGTQVITSPNNTITVTETSATQWGLDIVTPVTTTNGGSSANLSACASGGVPFFNALGVEGCSALLATKGIMFGGGAGSAPSTIAGYGECVNCDSVSGGTLLYIGSTPAGPPTGMAIGTGNGSDGIWLGPGTGGNAPTGGNANLLGDGTNTIVNAPNAGFIDFRITNSQVGRFSASGGFSVGSITDPGANNILAVGSLSGATYKTATNCQSSTGACGSAAAGMVTIAAAATTRVVSTSAVTANSEIQLTEDESIGGTLGVTCNTQLGTVLGTLKVTARSAGTSFTVGIDVAPTTNPICLHYEIKN